MRSFIDPVDLIDKNIFTLLKLENTPEEKKQKILNDMIATVQNRIIARILDIIDDSGLQEFEKLLDGNNEENMKAFLTQHNIDLTAIVAEESLNYKTEIINLIKNGPPKQEG